MRDPVLIAGGGIGGLAAALALAARGIASHVIERRSNPTEVGAGIQIGPNGTRILRRLGVGRLLEANVSQPTALRIMSAAKGTEITRLPLGSWIELRHGSPYLTAHRHDLHAALLKRAHESQLISITYGEAVQSADHSGAKVIANLESGGSIEGPALVGADGLWSAVRREVMGSGPLAALGKIAVRSVLPAHGVDAVYRECVHVWLAPGAHVVHYPVRAASELALIVIIDGDEDSEGWGIPIGPSDLSIKLGRLSLAPELRSLLSRPGAWRLWSLQGLRKPVPFAKGQIALLGDAAHPVLPFLAQGAVLALEDADALAEALAKDVASEAAFRAYAKGREPRAARVVRASAMNGRIYHLEGPAAAARDFVLRHSPPARIMAGLDWLYGYKTP